MKDVFRLKQKILIAAGILPLGAASLLGASGCSEVEYQSGEVTEESNNANSNNSNSNNTNSNNTDPNNSNSNNSNSNNSNNTDPNNIALPDTCEARAEGELEVEEWWDSCEGGLIYRWYVPKEEVFALSQEPCNSINENIMPRTCPEVLKIVAAEDPVTGDARDQDLVWELESDDGDVCVYFNMAEEWFGCEGRPLVSEDGSTTAAPRLGDSWLGQSHETCPESLPLELRRVVGEMWLKAALFEHASIASFARVSLELMAHAAPPGLIAAVQQAGLDEVRHAQDCFGMASLYLDGSMEPGALEAPPVRTSSLVELAVETFLEGAVEETVATLNAMRALEGCTFGPAQETLTTIIDDETRHAATAWATIRWALEKGGEPVARALKVAAEEAKPSTEIGFAAPSLAPEVANLLRSHGKLGPADHLQAERDAWEGVILPTLHEVLESFA